MNSNMLTFLISTFSTKFRDGFEKQMSEIELHAGQVFVLYTLWQTDGQSQAEIGKNLTVSAPTVYNMVIKMADKGFIEIRKDAADARIMRIFLTPKGVEIKPLVEDQWFRFEEQTFNVLTETERMMFSLLLQKLIENIMTAK